MAQLSGVWTLSQVSQAVQNGQWLGGTPPTVEYLIVADGGGGGVDAGGGGGAGGVHSAGGTPLRANYAGLGFVYDATNDVFHASRPKDRNGVSCDSFTIGAPT